MSHKPFRTPRARKTLKQLCLNFTLHPARSIVGAHVHLTQIILAQNLIQSALAAMCCLARWRDDQTSNTQARKLAHRRTVLKVAHVQTGRMSDVVTDCRREALCQSGSHSFSLSVRQAARQATITKTTTTYCVNNTSRPRVILSRGQLNAVQLLTYPFVYILPIFSAVQLI